jgi:hypothetical protein
MDVAQRLQELRAFDGDLHSYFPPDPTEHVVEVPGAARRG